MATKTSWRPDHLLARLFSADFRAGAGRPAQQAIFGATAVLSREYRDSAKEHHSFRGRRHQADGKPAPRSVTKSGFQGGSSAVSTRTAGTMSRHEHRSRGRRQRRQSPGDNEIHPEGNGYFVTALAKRHIRNKTGSPLKGSGSRSWL